MNRALAWVLVVAGLLAASGCGLGRRVTGEPFGAGAATQMPAPAADVVFTTARGFPLRAGILVPGLVAAYRYDDRNEIAPPGQHFLTVAVTVTNPTKDRPAPFGIGSAEQPPLLFFAVPQADARLLRLRCATTAGLARAFDPVLWCPVPLRTSSSRLGGSPLTTDLLPPGISLTDYYYTAEPLADRLLKLVALDAWSVALQSGPTTFVELTSGRSAATAPLPSPS